MDQTAKTTLPDIPSERGDDLHNIEYMEDADLVLFMAGNQFMVMDDLIREFRDRCPGVERVFYETLPPGLELKQILAGGAVFGDKKITGNPDIYTSVTEEAMTKLRSHGLIRDYSVYLHNRIVLMVPKDNPAGVQGVRDLAKDHVRISQTGEMEDITHHIVNMYDEAGGESLVKRIMEEKRAEGTTIFTLVHHRETPLRIKNRTADVGPVWATEVINARHEGLEVDAVEPGENLDQRDNVNYFIAKLNNAPNPENAEKFLGFIQSEKARNIYRDHGFTPHYET